MLVGLVDPGLEPVALRRRTGPVLIFAPRGRIDDAGDVAGAREHEGDVAAEEARPVEDGARRGDMILAGGEIIDRDLDVPERDLRVADRQLPLGELVVEIAIPQIKRVVGGGHSRGV